MAGFEERANALIARLDGGEKPDHLAGELSALRGCWRELGADQRERASAAAAALAQRTRGTGAAGAAAGAVRLYVGPPDPDALLTHYGLSAFRPGQREAVSACLAGRDALVIMPTGGGKSLCYILPGLASARLTVVVSPLIALMSDQHRRLAAGGHPVVMLASGMPEDHNRAALAAIRTGSARIAYCSPERFASRAFIEALATRELALFVVDEAHCLSEWGHDFRPDYLRLQAAAERLGRPPVLACTATATPAVAEEIEARLGLREPLVVHGGFDRPNLSFDVLGFEGRGARARKLATLLAVLRMPENRPAIVYAGTRAEVDDLSLRLSQEGLRAVGYHAGMAPAARARAQARFLSDEADVVVATNAFGMGVDKPDVRSVIHHALPGSIEAYYQEAGRAGRDGRPARALLLAMRADLGRLIRFNQERSTDVRTVAAHVERLSAAAGDARVCTIEPPREDAERVALAVAERAGALRLAPAGRGMLEVTLTGRLDRHRAREICNIAKDRGWRAYRAIERYASGHEECRRRQILEHFGDLAAGVPSGRCCDVCDP
ncbi:MAG: RecQ family ATP-dependent DNA helicase, partial [Solirubrobacteraceae bacterium]